MSVRMLLNAFLALGMVLASGCGSDSSSVSDDAETPSPDAGPGTDADAEVPQPDATIEPDAAPPGDPLCPSAQQCTDLGGGRMACLTDGEIPADAPTNCMQTGCAGNASCVYTSDDQSASACLTNCGTCPASTQCVEIPGAEGHRGCLTESGTIPAGAPTQCHQSGGCPGNMTCFMVSATESVCIGNCSACREGTCGEGEVCGSRGMCVPDCTGLCGDGEMCHDGECIGDIGQGPGAGPGPTCSLPQLMCTTACAELVQFSPTNNPSVPGFDPMLGYIDYPENGESWNNQYRSYLRRDLMMAVKYAAAKTACKAKGWPVGNGTPIGLIDMSEDDGSIPGTSVGSPGHPEGTHTNGSDIDIGYYQDGTNDNRARPVCEHTVNGQDAYHCTAVPEILDAWRTALFVGSLLEHPKLRIIGMDGKVGPMVEASLDALCTDGWISGNACGPNRRLVYEPVDMGWGWFYFHHHHFHVSLSP